MKPYTSIFALPLVLAPLCMACPGNPPTGDTDGGETGDGGGTYGNYDEECDECETTLWLCVCKDTFGVWQEEGVACQVASPPDSDCYDHCKSKYYPTQNPAPEQGTIDDIIEVCSEESSSSCGSWDPASAISYNSGTDTYWIPFSFVAGLVADPEPLWDCDSATIGEVSGGGFEIESPSSGEFLYELGLRDGDLPQDLNGFDLENYLDVATAFTDLWYNDSETSYTLEVLRGASTETFNYEVYYD